MKKATREELAAMLMRLQMMALHISNACACADPTPEERTIHDLSNYIGNLTRVMGVDSSVGRLEPNVPVDLFMNVIREDEIPLLQASYTDYQERFAAWKKEKGFA